MERYFSKRSKQYDEGNKIIDFKLEDNFPFGIMHEYQ